MCGGGGGGVKEIPQGGKGGIKKAARAVARYKHSRPVEVPISQPNRIAVLRIFRVKTASIKASNCWHPNAICI